VRTGSFTLEQLVQFRILVSQQADYLREHFRLSVRLEVDG